MIRARLANFARRVLGSMGCELLGPQASAWRRTLASALPEWSGRNFSCKDASTFTAVGVLFSRDRALQLHALLQSWFAQVQGEARLVVLWTASSATHAQSYRELQQLWQGRVEWVREADFRSDLLSILAAAQETHLFFLTDDAVVLRPFRLSQLLLPDPDRRIASLTHGPELDWCFIAQRPQAVPALEAVREDLLSWRWQDGEPGLDWAFLLSVDGKFFALAEMRLLVSHLPFTSPNTLEMGLQTYLPLFIGRRGVCLGHASLVNIPCNTVQQDYANHETALHTADELLRHWQAGERIVWEDFQALAPASAEVRSYRFAARC